MTSFSGSRVVVLGGAGFIGSHLCEELHRRGAAVVAIDSLITGAAKNLRPLERHVGFDFVEADITRPLVLEGNVDFVFNLASPASPVDYLTHWRQTMRTGSLGTENALEFALQKKAVFLQASTSEVYGDPLLHPQAESYLGNVDCTGPRAVYDEAKRYGEAMVHAFRRWNGLSTRVVRIFNTYGPRMRLNDGRVVPAFIAQALAGEPLTIQGDGNQTRSFCFVADLVDGLARLALSSESEPVNIGNPDERSILEFAKAVLRVTGSKSRIEFRPLPQGDPRVRKPDITRARTLLGWEPKMQLDEGLALTVDYFARIRASGEPTR